MPRLLKPGGPSVWDPWLTRSLTAPPPDPVILKQIENAFFDDATIINLMYGSFIYITESNLMDTGLTKYGAANALDYANTWLAKKPLKASPKKRGTDLQSSALFLSILLPFAL